jgi:hypothetical protein
MQGRKTRSSEHHGTLVCGVSTEAVFFLSLEEILASSTRFAGQACLLPSEVKCVLPIGSEYALVGCSNGVVYRVRRAATSADPVAVAKAAGSVVGIVPWGDGAGQDRRRFSLSPLVHTEGLQ